MIGRSSTRVRLSDVRVIAALLLLSAGILGGCSVNSDPYAFITPGPTPPPRPGAHVWVVGAPDVLLGSDDGGASWRLAHRGAFGGDSLADLWGVAFGDDSHGWAIERLRGRILSTRNGGLTWTWQFPRRHGKLLAIAASDAKHAWAVGSQGVQDDRSLILATSDGGITWKPQAAPRHLELYGVAFSDSRHGWALGGSPGGPGYAPGGSSTVLATVDGGAHWRVSYRTPADRQGPAFVTLSGLACNGTRRCWVVGFSGMPGDKTAPGLVVATTDGGAHWKVQRSVAAQPLADVAFPDARHGWAVGRTGTIVTSSDGGTTWTAQHTDARYDLKEVAFSDAGHGWAIIEHTALLTTNDGGATWSVVAPSPTRYFLAGVTCYGPAPSK